MNGQSWPPQNDFIASPFSFSLIRGFVNNSLSLEIGLPSTFLNDSAAEFLEGDFIEMDVELILPPRLPRDYFGASQRLIDWLIDADVDGNFENGWKIVALEANKGDDITITLLTGSLERKYPPRVCVNAADEAIFNLDIPSDVPGVLPITVSGVGETDNLVGNPPPQRLWRRSSDGSWLEFGRGGDFQLNRDEDGTYTYVYSLRLEFDNVGLHEQFYFGEKAPVSGTSRQFGIVICWVSIYFSMKDIL